MSPARKDEGAAKIRHPLSLLVVVAVAAGLCACGGAGKQPASIPRAAAAAGAAGAATSDSTSSTSDESAKMDADRDNDAGVIGDDRDNVAALGFGHPAGAADHGAIAALVKRYYSAALAGDGTRACSMLYSTLAEAAPEDYGLVPGPIYTRGATTCQAVTHRLFAHFHAQLAAEVPGMAVAHVLQKEGHAIAVLSFVSMPGREIQLRREGHVWKLAALLDSALP